MPFAQLTFTDQTGLEAVELQFGLKYARGLTQYGPEIINIVGDIDQIFLLAQVKRIMVQNGFKFATPIQLQKSAMAVIRYTNASDEPWYFLRMRSAGSWQWKFIPLAAANKQPYRDRDRADAERGRVIVQRGYTMREAAIEPYAIATHHATGGGEYKVPRGPDMPVHELMHIRKALGDYLAKMNHPPGAMSASQMAKILISSGFVPNIGQDFADDLTQYNAEQIEEACALVYDMLAADQRGLVAKPGEKLDLL